MTATIDLADHDAAIFDLDGVVTDTASVHEAAWTLLFDEFLAGRPDRAGEDHAPFTHEDYLRHVDGKRRLDGIAAFLASRGIHLPTGGPDDPEDAATLHALAERKDGAFRQRLARDGVDAFGSTVALVRRLQGEGLGTAVFSASRNCAAVLEAAGLGDLFPVRVDGVVAAELDLPGKPDPATLLEATRRLGALPARTVVVEDAQAGVEAGRRGGFGLVIGIDRSGGTGDLATHGADVVVGDLAEVEVVGERPTPLSSVPDALAGFEDLAASLADRPMVVFLDFDGTLSPIVDDPDAARPTETARAALARLAGAVPVAVVSGRDLADVERRVGVGGLWYAGSHGFEVAGPAGQRYEHEPALDALDALDEAERALSSELVGIPGAIVERKRFALSAHYRQVAPDRADEVVDAVDRQAAAHPGLRVAGGRRVAELRPDLDWGKGRALRWVLDQIDPDGRATPVYAGDDLTDEDALAEIRGSGCGIVVRSDEHGDRPTAARWAVEGPEELGRLLERLAEVVA
jgi:trehalose-phosphatase